MTFIIAKKGTRQSDSKIYISKIARTITLSAGFCREHDIDLEKIKFARLAMDSEKRDIAIDLVESGGDSREYLKLSLTQTKTAASFSVNPILTTFKVDIKDIAGAYRGRAIEGPERIPGFSNNALILKTKYRET